MRNLAQTPKPERDGHALLRRKPTPQIGKRGNAFEREAENIAYAVVRGDSANAGWSISKMGVYPAAHPMTETDPKHRGETVERQAQPPPKIGQTEAPVAFNRVQHAAGRPLGETERTFMEARIDRDFNQVRIHTDAEAAESAVAINARAYTHGNHIVFAPGQYHPETATGRYLLAHELVHVAQQSDQPAAHTGWIQRVGFFESIARFFGGGTFSEKELLSYIDFLNKRKTIEDAYDSDNKAREVVRRWKKGDAAFSILTVPLRILLIKEMASGYLSGDDQDGILALLEESITSELTTILREIGIDKLKVRFDGQKRKRLYSLISDQQDEEAIASMGGKWSVKGVSEILNRHGDGHIIRTLIDQGYTVIRFKTAFDKWRYDDGSIKEEELKNLRGNRSRTAPEIRLRDTLSKESAASTLYHEVSHVKSKEPDYLTQEIDVRVQTEEFKIRHGLPPTNPGYRNPDGTVNRDFIKKEIEGSPHYNPVGRKRIGRRYVNEKKVSGWKMP